MRLCEYLSAAALVLAAQACWAGPAARPTVALDPATGALRVVAADGTRVLASGPDGLWTARMLDGTEWRAADFAGRAGRSVEVRRGAGRTTATYRAPELAVTVRLLTTADGADVVGYVRPASGTVVEFAAPARLQFDARRVRRMVFPADGNQGVGLALNRGFFLPQPVDRPAAWTHELTGSAGYEALFGGRPVQGPDQDSAVPLRVTEEGRTWLGPQAARLVEGSSAVVNRPPRPEQVQLVLVTSERGAWLSGATLGGSGVLWRIGGSVGEAERAIALAAVAAVAKRAAAATGRRRVGVLSVPNGPAAGGWAAVPVSDWFARLGLEEAPTQAIASHQALLDALADPDVAAIVNPYGEWMLSPPDRMAETVRAVGAFVRGGGHWFETGGFPFHYALVPARHLSVAGRYPPMFADFAHLDTEDTSVSVYGVRPPAGAPWSAASDPARIFVPGVLGCGSLPEGGYLDRAYAPWVAPGATWRSPVTRLALGGAAERGLAEYARSNGIAGSLRQKLPGPLFGRFARAPLLYYGGSADQKRAALPRLPVPTLIHWADYLKGGFDKEYPDHLPPNAGFGTMDQLAGFMAEARSRGHLVMPYTNGTWWCDHPRGPTFLEHGEAPLLRTPAGALSYERYGQNDGYTVTHWHPAVQAANRRTRAQFTKDAPADLVFQDQNAARSWAFDLNPASPRPYAYIEGLLSNAVEDSRYVPLSTEGGWDRMANAHAQLCGMTWNIVPTEHAPEWRRLFKETVPPDTWTVYPLAQRLAHDQCAFLMHDLGQFITNRQVLAWTLALGFGLSFRAGAGQMSDEATRGWFDWLSRLQKSVAARYTGQPVRGFQHTRQGGAGPEDDGLMRAVYWPVTVTSNLGPAPRQADGRLLAPYGFFAASPGMTAGALQRVGPHDLGADGGAFAAEAGPRAVDVWFWARAGDRVAAELPVAPAAGARVRVAGSASRGAAVRGKVVALRLPAPAAGMAPPAVLAARAPLEWPGGPPAIGVLDFPNGPVPSWTRMGPGEWFDALRATRVAREDGVRVEAIRDTAQLFAALEAGPARWLVIVNPYGEGIPQRAPGAWRDTLAAIKAYVRAGGTWWETAGYSFYLPFSDDGAVQSAGPAALASLGLAVGDGPVAAPEEPLQVTETGRQWLGAEEAAALERAGGAVNRSLPGGVADLPHVALVRSGERTYIGAYRFGGWGWMWRVGGFWPRPDVVRAVVTRVTERIYRLRPAAPAPDGPRTLWHARVTW